MTKTLSEMTRTEWMLWHWVNVRPFSSSELEFIRGNERTPDEAAEAGRDFDEWLQARRGWDARQEEKTITPKTTDSNEGITLATVGSRLTNPFEVESAPGATVDILHYS